MKQEELYQEISELLVSLFEIEPDQIKPESRLYEDLDLDSIDAVDMIVYLQKKPAKKSNRKHSKVSVQCRMLLMY